MTKGYAILGKGMKDDGFFLMKKSYDENTSYEIGKTYKYDADLSENSGFMFFPELITWSSYLLELDPMEEHIENEIIIEITALGETKEYDDIIMTDIIRIDRIIPWTEVLADDAE